VKAHHRTAASVLFAAVVSLAVGGQGPAPGRAVPPDIRAAAEAGIKEMLEPGAGGGLDRLGFRDRAEAAGVTVGAGFQVFVVPPDLLLASKPAALEALATPSNQWVLLVVSGATPKSLVTVDLIDGAWKAVSIGGAGLSEEIAALLGRWPASAYRHRFIRSYQAGAEVMEVSRDGRVLGAVPFLSARVSLGASGRFDPGDLWPGSQVVSRMRPAVKAAMDQKR
jgi:hypothetical protein